MYLDENLPPKRVNAPHLDASACKEEYKHYIRQVELLHLPGVMATHNIISNVIRYRQLFTGITTNQPATLVM